MITECRQCSIAAQLWRVSRDMSKHFLMTSLLHVIKKLIVTLAPKSFPENLERISDEQEECFYSD